MQPAEVRLTLYRQTGYAEEFQFQDEARVLVDFTGYTGVLEARDSAGTRWLRLTTAGSGVTFPSDGLVRLSAPLTVTSALPSAGSLTYALLLAAGGADPECWLKGVLAVEDLPAHWVAS